MTKSLDIRALQAAGSLTPTTIDTASIEEYVLYWARHPQPGSIFAKLTRFLRWLPDSAYLFTLRKLRYGGHILFLKGRPIGHIFYQQHGSEIHMFSIEVEHIWRTMGYGNRLMRSFLLEMGERDDIDILRISAGGDERVVHMWRKTLAGGYDLPYQAVPCEKPGDGWVRIVRS